jgi:hypothetical protein
VGGKPGQHRCDRLGLLLVKAAASLATQQLHLDGEPWRPWSWPSRAAAALAGGGLAGTWLGLGIGVGVVHARLLARPPLPALPAEIHGWTAGGSVAPKSRSCLDHADQGVHAAPGAGAADERAPPTTSQRQGGIAARWRCTRAATAAPPLRRLSPGPTTWLAGVAQRTRAARAPLEPTASHRGGGASVGSPADHRPFTRVSRLVHPSITRPGRACRYSAV